MKAPPKSMLPLIDMASSDDVGPEQFREALGKHDKAQLDANGFHLIQALSGNSDLAFTSMKFACIHQALGTEGGAIWAPMSSQMVGKDGKYHQLSDQQASVFVQYVLDALAVEAFPGLIYMACHFGWPQCAKLLMDRGVYRPLEWRGFAGTTDEERAKFAELLLKVVRPSGEDIKIIRRGFKDGESAALIFDRAMI